MNPRRSLGGAIALRFGCLLLIAVLGAGCAAERGRPWRLYRPSERLSLRVWSRWDADPGPQMPFIDDWGWDSTEWRPKPGESLSSPEVAHWVERPGDVTGEAPVRLPVLSLGRRLGRDSVWLRFRGVSKRSNEREVSIDDEVVDSLVLVRGAAPVTLRRPPGHPILRVAWLDRRSEPKASVAPNRTLTGRLTGFGVLPVTGRILVAGTKLLVATDSLGRFALEGLPNSPVRLIAIASERNGKSTFEGDTVVSPSAQSVGWVLGFPRPHQESGWNPPPPRPRDYQLTEQAFASRIADAGAPTLPFVVPGACPFECCQYGGWLAIRSVEVRTAPDPGSAKLFTLSAGDSVVADTGLVVVERLGLASAQHATTVDGVALNPGDLIYVLHPEGEGYFRCWRRGVAFSAELVGFEHGRPAGSALAIRWTPDYEWWARIRTLSGRTGWVQVEGEFLHTDGCE